MNFVPNFVASSWTKECHHRWMGSMIPAEIAYQTDGFVPKSYRCSIQSITFCGLSLGRSSLFLYLKTQKMFLQICLKPSDGRKHGGEGKKGMEGGWGELVLLWGTMTFCLWWVESWVRSSFLLLSHSMPSEGRVGWQQSFQLWIAKGVCREQREELQEGLMAPLGH